MWTKRKLKIEDIIYEVRGKQVILDSNISETECHYYLHDKIITHNDISLPISLFNNFL